MFFNIYYRGAERLPWEAKKTMEICSEIIGNLHDDEWKERARNLKIDYIPLDQWTAQKSRFLAKGESGTEYPVALKRQTQVVDGDIVPTTQPSVTRRPSFFSGGNPVRPLP